MDSRLISAFGASAESTFHEMFALNAKAMPPRELEHNEDHGWDMTGLVGLAGEAQGVVAFRLTKELATRLLSATGVPSANDGDEELVGGFVAEVTNILAGGATTALKGFDVEIAPPVVISGPNHRISWPSIAPVVALGFDIPDGHFEIDLCVRHR